MDVLKKASKETKTSKIKWHIPYTGFYSSIEFLDKYNVDWLIKECDKKNILLKDLKGCYLNDYLSSNILKLSVGSVESDDIKKGIQQILKIIEN